MQRGIRSASSRLRPFLGRTSTADSSEQDVKAGRTDRPELPECGVPVNPLPQESGLVRRFIDDANHITWDGDTPIPHPLSNSVQFDDDGLSLYWRQHLDRDGLGLASVLEGRDAYTLVGEVSVAAVERVPMNVKHDPLGEADEPLLIRCAHTLINWHPATVAPGSLRPDKHERKKLKYALAREFHIELGEVSTPTPDGL